MTLSSLLSPIKSLEAFQQLTHGLITEQSIATGAEGSKGSSRGAGRGPGG